MKRLGMIILSAILACAMCSAAFAGETEPEGASEVQVKRLEEFGIDLPLIGAFQDSKGLIYPQGYGPIDSDHHTYFGQLLYIAMPKEEAQADLNNPDLPDEEYEELTSRVILLSLILVSDAGYDSAKQALVDAFGDSIRADLDAPVEVGSADGFTFYHIPDKAEESAKILEEAGEEFAAEYEEMTAELDDVLKKAGKYAPLDYDKNMVGKKIDFTSVDLDGNTVNVKDLFAENEITMVNCWGIWCPNCVNEMPELAELHTRLQEKGCGIVGIEWERTADPAAYEGSKDALEEYGTNYPNVVMTEEFCENVGGFPTTYFVDKEGTVLCMPICGAYVDKYEPTLEALLAGESVDADEEEPARTGDSETGVSGGYDIAVKDADGNPVEGVMVQMCDDVTCNFGSTGADGIAHFDVPFGREYDVHVVVVPDGYEADENSYKPEEGSNVVTIELKKAA